MVFHRDMVCLRNISVDKVPCIKEILLMMKMIMIMMMKMVVAIIIIIINVQVLRD
jgi:hypothetical protein